MKREYPEQPLLEVGKVIVDSGGVVLVKRGKAPLMGEWGLADERHPQSTLR